MSGEQRNDLERGGFRPDSRPAAPHAAEGLAGPAAVLRRLPRQVPRVGRAAEFTYLQSQFDDVLAGRGGRLLFVSGDPGVGKTRLVLDLAGYVRSRGSGFLAGRYLRSAGPAYGPWVEALQVVLRVAWTGENLATARPYQAELAGIFPDIPALAGQPTGHLEFAPEEQRRRLYEGVAEVVLGLARQNPYVLFIDDLQWAPGLSLLAHAARRVAGAPVLLIGAYRAAEFHDQPHLVREHADLHRNRLFTEVPLAPFTEAETGELTAHYFGADAALQLADPLYRTTRGNAFFIEEVLRSLVESGGVRDTGTEWIVVDPGQMQIPGSMRLAVSERVTRLGPALQDVLTAASVLGQEFSFPVLHAFTELAEADLVAALDRALAARLIRDVSTPVDERYAFWDDQVQEVLYESISPPRRYRFHRKAGEALEHLFAGRTEDLAEELARHYGAAHDPEKLAHYALVGAEKSFRLHNWTRARRLYDEAATALAGLPDTPDNRRRRATACLKRVMVGFVADNPAHNLERLAEAEAAIEDLLPAGNGRTQEGERRAGDADTILAAQIHYWTGRLLVYRLDYPAAVPYFERVQRMAEAAGNPELRDLAISSLGRTWAEAGDFLRATPLLRAAAPALAVSGNWAEWIWNHSFLGFSLAAQGRRAEAVEHLEQALERCRTAGIRNLIGPAYLHLALVHYFGDDPAAMAEAARQGVRAGEQTDNLFPAFLSSGALAWAESRLGHSAAADEWLARYEDLGQRLGGGVFVYSDVFRAASAEISLRAGRYTESRDQALAALELAQRAESRWAAGLARRVLAEAVARCTDTPGPDIDAHLAAAREDFLAGGAWVDAARTALLGARLAAERGDRRAAAVYRGQVAEAFERTGRPDEAAAVRRGTEQRPASPTAPAYPDGLSEREVQVLRLIAAGRTTKEIAADLIVSVATVERHITNLYTKIDARGRAEATAYAIRRGLAAPPDPSN